MYAETPHRRYNPLTDEWILVSPHRTKRPWQGQTESLPPEDKPAYDPTCYLCPGNERAGGVKNPDYESTYVFTNDFPALMPELPDEAPPEDTHSLLRVEPERGTCRVICFSPRHDLTLAMMAVEDIRQVVDLWAYQTLELAGYAWLHYVQIFENRGAMMGSSNPHPHGQLWATETIPEEPRKEDATQRSYFETHKGSLLTDILHEELIREERIVWQDEHWVVLVPFWAVWPYETLLISKRHVQFLHQMHDIERDSLAAALSAITVKYDNLFQTQFPYSMGIHQAPVNTPDVEHWHLHLHFYPPLLRSATVRKFMVGFEMLGTPQRDITAEMAAATLRELPDKRFG